MAHGITRHGLYTIRLQVTDNEGNIDTGETTLTVTSVAPTITSVPENITGNEGDTLVFNGTVTFTDPGDDTFTCLIDWGYGTPTTLGAVTSPFSLPTHVYEDNGLFTITINITDTGPETGQGTLQATIANVPPSITGTLDQTGTEGTPVLFTAGPITDPGSDDTHTYYWDWDNDGTLDEGPLTVNTVAHTWPDDYTGTVRVQVRDDDGGMDNDTCLINITNVAPTAPTDILVSPFPYSAGDTITATAIGSTDPGTDILTYQYRFYDFTDSLLLQDWGTGNTLYITALLEGHTLQIDARAHDDDGGISGTTTVTITPCACRKGDFNQNCMIDIFDLDKLGQAWGTTTGNPLYHESMDFDDNGVINILDLDAFAQVWGQTYCPCGTCAAPPWQLWP